MFVVYLFLCVLRAGLSATSTCSEGYVPCSEPNATCILQHNWCDGEFDCSDGSDELDCDVGNLNSTGQSKFVLAVLTAARYLLSQRKADYGWDDFTPRALIALSFAKKYLPISEKEKSLMTKRLDLQLFFLLRDGVDNLASLALHINALYAMCQDPRDFHGIDLVEILRSRANKAIGSNFNLPIVLLTLCLANDSSPGDFDELVKIYNDKRNDRVGIKALTLIAMSACVDHSSKYIDKNWKNYDHTIRHFLNDYRHHDENIDVYSKALICQLYNTWRYDTSPLRSKLLDLQAEDGSFGDLLGTYSAIPAIMNMSFADLRCKSRTYKEKASRSTRSSDSMFKSEKRIDYSLLISGGQYAGNHTMKMTFEGERSFFDVMKMAEYENLMYRFKYDESDTGKKVYFLAGIPNDAEKGITWTLYRNPKENSTKNRNKVIDGVDRIFPEDGDHFIFQLEYSKML